MFNLQNKNISVVGDAIIDDYYFVNAEKVSPEFPIPILQCENLHPNKRLLGGATNVCYQFLNIAKQIFYFGLIDLEVYDLLSDFSFINSESCCLLPNFSKNPVKKRFYQDSFPLCRLDIESNNYNLSNFELNKLQNKICDSLKKYKLDAVIFSDYDKGLFNNFEIKNYFESLDKKTLKIVDPKKGPISKWRGCDLIKPNYKEAVCLTGKENWKEQIDIIKKSTDCETVVITMGGDGVVGCVGNYFFEHYPSIKTNPTSVIGAGDCFISLLCSCLLSGFSTIESVELAFKGSSIYVNDKFNKPIDPLRLLKGKVIDPCFLSDRNFSLCFTNGCFDIIHEGHIELLKFAKSKADKLVVAVNSDISVSLQNKSHPLINNLQSRLRILESLEFVDYLVVFDDKTPYKIINTIKPDFLVKGQEYQEPVGSDIVEKVFLCPMVENFSTTKLIEKINNLKT